MSFIVDSAEHRRMMEREAKAKVVACVWGGADLVQFLAALAIFPRLIWKNMMNSTFSSKSTKARKRDKELNKFCPPNRRFASLSIFLLCCRNKLIPAVGTAKIQAEQCPGQR